jgi:dolichol-phosphate mannosyltransferase
MEFRGSSGTAGTPARLSGPRGRDPAAGPGAGIRKISFVAPVYNEAPNVRRLVDELRGVADGLGRDYEVLLVDDGSTDGSLAAIKALAEEDPRIKYLSFERNAGQSAALYAGFQRAGGDVIVTLDADLQNDPADIPRLLELFGPYDMVTGWRARRMDSLSKRIGSRIGNFVRNRLTRESIRDTGCSLKVMRADMARRMKIYRGLHRFLPTLMRLEGARVAEVRVNHRPRLHGTSKYTNLKRGVEGLYDLIAVRWMIKRHLAVRVKESNV